MRVASLAVCAALLLACHDRANEPVPKAADIKPASALAVRLRGDSHFLVGLGNDLEPEHDRDGAYRLGPTLDLHYVYVVGLPGFGGWPEWNPDGSFVDIIVKSSLAHGVTPMFTLYAMAAWGEEKDVAALTVDKFMRAYWQGAKLLFQRLGAATDKPSVVHLEPDFWGFAQQATPDGSHAVHVKSLVPECGDLTDDLHGMVGCLLKLAHTYAPHTAVGFHASRWAGTPAAIVRFFRAIGADQADFIATDMLDRDAGCWEAQTDPVCKGKDRGSYWDESNTTSPNFREALTWAKQIHDGVGLPIMWWQVPLGVPSPTPGGTSGHYRDNRVHYMFNHVDELVAAGGVGMVFGTGAERQTTIDTDGGQFKAAVTKYFASPVRLP